MKISGQAEKIAANLFGRLLANGWVKVPPGFKLVPIEPMPEQILAGAAKYYTGDVDEHVAAIYRAMVEESPPAASVLNGEV